MDGTIMQAAKVAQKLTMQGKRWLVSLAAISVMLVGQAASASASEITGIILDENEGGTSLQLAIDSPTPYQVFELEGPDRVVLMLQGSKLGKQVAAVTGGGRDVTGVESSEDNGAVRVTINLAKQNSPVVSQNEKGILVAFKAPVQPPVAARNGAAIKDVIASDHGSVTELVLRGDNMDANHNAFMTNDGKTMIIDFWGGESLLAKERFRFSTQRISGVNVGAAEGRVRMVVELMPTSNQNHQIDVNGNEMIVRFGQVAPKRKAAVVTVEDISFRPDDRIAHVVIRTDSANPVIKLREKDGNVLVDVAKATLAAGQEQTQDVSAFPGPVKQIDAYRVDDTVRVVVRPRDQVRTTTFQQGNILTLNFEPEDMARARERSGGGKEALAYTGQKVTFDFKDIDIRNALKLIAEMSDLNIIMSDDVKGSLTMHLVDVPWDQALDLILTARGLGKEQTGNVMRIAPIDVLRTEYQSKLEARQGSQRLEALVTEFITLSFTKVAEVKKMLDSASASQTRSAGFGGAAPTAAGAAGAAATPFGGIESSIGLLSPRGSFLIDERTNTLIIHDTEDSINNIKRLIATIDKPVQQVLIEARIVEATENFQRDIGISWGVGYTGQTKYNFPGLVRVGGANSLGAGANRGVGAGNTVMVDLPAAVGRGSGGSIGLSLGSFNNAVNLALELSAAESDGDVKIVSNPRVVTTNLKPAYIKQGIKVGFVVPATANNPATVELKDALLSLTVTPQITADNNVIMDVTVRKDTPTIFNTSTGIDSKEINTNIFMKNGETVVIGGVYTREKGASENGLPLLSKIPLLGYLFKRETSRDNKTELLIFLTPKVLQSTGDIAASK